MALLVDDLIDKRRQLEREVNAKCSLKRRGAQARARLEACRDARRDLGLERARRHGDIQHLSDQLDFARQQIEDTERLNLDMRENQEVRGWLAKQDKSGSTPALDATHSLVSCAGDPSETMRVHASSVQEDRRLTRELSGKLE